MPGEFGFLRSVDYLGIVEELLLRDFPIDGLGVVAAMLWLKCSWWLLFLRCGFGLDMGMF